MSSIDQRIVEMQFKNSEFERGIKESLKSLKNLKNGLDLDDSTKSMKDLQKAGDSFSLSKMANAVDDVASRFTFLGRIGVQVMDRLAEKAVNTGERLLKSLTTDQLISGWNKYNQKTASIQTIMNATGKSVEEVNACLDELMWFSDETSYNFTEMTSALGTMTSSGGQVEKLIPMIEGMAAATAFAGKNASEFSRVIYNLNQSYGQGFLSYMDWRSVELAGVGSEQLKQTIIDTAVAMGTLKKASDGAARTANGTLVTIGTMASTLSERWATSEVMEQAFGKFGEIFQEAYYLVQTGQYATAADAIASLAGQYDEVFFNAAKAAQEAKTFSEAIEATKDAVSSGWMKTYELIFGNKDEATALWTDLANALYEVFASGSENRNALLSEWRDLGGRADLIQGITDALSGLWGIIVAIKDAFAEIFPPVTVDTLLSVSSAVKEFGANLKSALYYEELMSIESIPIKIEGNPIEDFVENLKKGMSGDSIKQLQERLSSLGYDVGPAGTDGIFGSKTQEALKQFQKDFDLVVDGVYGEKTHEKMKELLGTKSSVEFERTAWSVNFFGETLSKVKDIARGVFTVLKAGLKIVGFLWDVFLIGYRIILKPVFNLLFSVVSKIFGLFATLGEYVEYASGIFEYFGGVLLEWLSPVSDWIDNLGTSIGDFLDSGIQSLGGILKSVFGTISNVFGYLKNIVSEMKIMDKLSKGFDKIKKAFDKVKKTFGSVTDKLEEWWGKLKPIFTNILTIGLGAIGGIIIGVLYAVGVAFGKFASLISSVADSMPKYYEKVKGFFVGLWNTFKQTDLGSKLVAYGKKIQSFFKKVSASASQFTSETKQDFEELDGNLNKGMSGDSVKKLQERLMSLGYDLGESGADGKFGSKTQEALKQFQKDYGLIVDGIYSEDTHKKLEEVLNGNMSILDRIKAFFLGIWAEIKNTKFGQKLIEISGKIKTFFADLWTNLKNSDFVQNKLPKFKDNLKSFFSGIWNSLVSFGGKIPGIWKKVKTFFKDLWANLKNSDFVQNKLPKFKDNLKSFFSGIWDSLVSFGGKIPGIWKKVKTFFKALWANLKNSDFVQNKLPKFKDNLKSFFSGIWDSLVSFGGKIPGIWKKVKTFFVDIWDKIKSIFVVDTHDLEGLTFFEKIKLMFKNVSENLNGIFASIGSIWKIVKLVLLFKTIGKVFNSIAALKDKLPKKVDSIGNSLLKVAGAIGLLVLSIYLLGKMNPETFKKGAKVLASLAGGLALFIIAGTILGKMKLSDGFKSVGEAIRDMAVGILAISAAILILGRMKTTTLIRGGVTVLALLAGIMAMAKIFSGIDVQLKGFKEIGIVIALIAVVIWALGKMQTSQLAKGLGAIVLISAILVGFVVLINKFGRNVDFKGIGTLLLAFSGFIYFFAFILNKIKHIDPLVMISFAGSLAIALAAIVAACALAGNSKITGGAKGMTTGALSIAAAVGTFMVSMGAILSAFGLLNKWTKGGTVRTIKQGGEVLKAVADALKPLEGNLGLAIGAITLVSEALGQVRGGKSVTGSLWAWLDSAIIEGIFASSIAIATGITAGLGAWDEASKGDLVSDIKRGGKVLESVSKALETLGGPLGTAIGVVELISIVLGSIPGSAAMLIKAALYSIIIEGIFAAIVGLGVLILDGLGAWNEGTNGALASNIDSAGQVLGSVTEAIGRFFGGFKSGYLNQINDGLKEISDTKLDKKNLNTATDTLDQIATLSERINGSDRAYFTFSIGPFKVGEESPFSEFCDDVAKLGSKVASFATSISVIGNYKGIKNSINTALSICEKIAEFATEINGDTYQIELKKNGIFSWFTGKNETDSLVSYIEDLGGAINSFSGSIAGLSVTTVADDTATVTSVVTSIAEMLTAIAGDDITIEKAQSALKTWFVGENETQSLFTYIPTLGEKIKKLQEHISDLSKSNIVADSSAVKDVMTNVADLLTYISGPDVKLSTDYDNNLAQGAAGAITEFNYEVGLLGTAISEFDNNTKEVDLDRFSQFTTKLTEVTTGLGGIPTENMSLVSSAMDKLNALFSGDGKDSITTENFLKGLDITAVTEKLSSFTAQLGESIGANTETMAGYTQSFNSAGSTLAAAVTSGMSESADTSGIDAICKSMLKAAEQYKSKFNPIGYNFGKGLGIGISSSVFYVKTKAAYVANAAVKKVQEIFDEHSPSKVAIGIGRYFSQGLGIGIDQQSGSAVQSSENMARSIIDSARTGFSTLSAIVEDNMDTDPVVRPVVDLTNVQSGAKAINGMLTQRATISAKGSIDAMNDAASSVATRKANQNGKDGYEKSTSTMMPSEDNSVNLSGNNFYIRNDNDIHMLASEIAALTKSQQRSLGSAY